MIKKLLLMLVVILGSTSASDARNCFLYDNCFFAEGEAGIGYTVRKDSLSYKLDNSFCTIPFSTERDFDDIHINQITGYAKFITEQNLYIRGHFDYGWVASGSFEEIHNIENETIFHEKGSVSDQYVADVSIAFGTPLMVGCGFENFTFIPLFGYSWHHQKFRASSIRFILDVDTDFDPCFELCGLTEKYETNWYGPWIGFDAQLDVICDWKVFGGFEFHWAEYNGEFDRNSFTILTFTIPGLSRDDCGCGNGLLGYAGFNFSFCDRWYLTFMGSIQSWKVHCGRGIDTDGVISDLKKLKWSSCQLTLALHYPF